MDLPVFLLRRGARIVLSALIIASLAFLLLRLLPGDPAVALLGSQATDDAIARMRADMGLDRSISVQYAQYIIRLLKGDLGVSLAYRVPVLSLILSRLPITLALTGLAVLFALLLTVPLAFWSALRPGGVADSVIQLVVQIGLSTPAFYLGLLLLITLAAGLGWFPVGGTGEGFVSGLHHLTLPAFTLTIGLVAVLVRSLRDRLVQVMRSDFITFARAKGLPVRIILLRHVLRNALIATVTLLGLHIGSLVSGSVVVESVFAVSGMGRLMIDSIYMRDYPVVQGLIIVIAVMVSLVLAGTDLVLRLLDPRSIR